MKKKQTIYKKLAFLIESNFVYSYINDNLFGKCIYKKSNVQIIISYDCHNEFLNLLIKDDNNIILETSYSDVIIDYDSKNSAIFSSKLKSIYKMYPNRFSLNKKQIDLLLTLYAERLHIISQG